MWWIAPAANAASNVLGGIGARESSEAYNRYIQGQLPQIQQQYAQGMNQSVEGWKPYAQQGVQSLGDLASWRPEQMGQFAYNKDVNSFLDPSMQFQQEQQRMAQAESQAGRGRALGGAAAKELAQLQTNMAQTDYANSYNRMTNDKASTYQQFLNEFNAKNAASQARATQLGNLVNLGTNAQTNISSAQQNVATQGYNTGMYGAQAEAQARANNAGFGWNMAAGLLGGAGQMAGAAYNAGMFTPATTTPDTTVYKPSVYGQGQAKLVMNDFNPSLYNQQNNPMPTGNIGLNSQWDTGWRPQ